ncbi:hypothetical protein [Peribacillus asahii]
MKDGICDVCGDEFEIGMMFYDDICDDCAEGEGLPLGEEEEDA